MGHIKSLILVDESDGESSGEEMCLAAHRRGLLHGAVCNDSGELQPVSGPGSA